MRHVKPHRFGERIGEGCIDRQSSQHNGKIGKDEGKLCLILELLFAQMGQKSLIRH